MDEFKKKPVCTHKQNNPRGSKRCMGLSFLVLGMKRGSRYITVQREWGQSESGSLQPLTRVLFLLITGSTPEDGAGAARCRGKF